MTSVAYQPQPAEEPVSPELALVDPELAERLRPHLPAVLEENRDEAVAVAPLEQVAETAREMSLALAVEDAEPPRPTEPPTEVEPESADASAATVLVLPTPAQRVEIDRASPEMEEEEVLTVAAVAADVQPAAQPPPSPPASRSTLRRLLAAFGAGAVVASLVVVGVIAELGETGPPLDAGPAVDDGSPTVGASTLAPSGLGTAPSSTPTKPKAASPKPATRKAVTKAKSAGSKTNATKSAAGSTRKRAATSPAKKQTRPAERKRTAAPAAAPSRRFAWAPVEGAVGYRVELFRGDQQVLRATTKQPVYELAARWRHQGRAERLTPGSYRWYVWPVLRSGPAAEAIVQARLDVP